MGGVGCGLGTLPPDASTYMDIVVVPQEPGTLTAAAWTNFGVIGRAPAPLSPRTEANITIDPV